MFVVLSSGTAAHVRFSVSVVMPADSHHVTEMLASAVAIDGQLGIGNRAIGVV